MRTRWAGWSEEEIAEGVARLDGVRDRVLDGARIAPGQTVVDVGAGTGLLTLGAVGRVGPEGEVVAVDISVDALEELRRLSAAPNIFYLVGSADVLPLPDASVDAVLTRSVLIYLRDKAEAAREFFRVLRRGGRFSVFEPINSRNLLLHRALDLAPLGELAARLGAWIEDFYRAPRDTMLDFDENDLARWFENAGFDGVDSHLGAQEDAIPGHRYLKQVGAPGRPTLLQRLEAAFTPEDVAQIVGFLEERAIPVRFPHLFLAGSKP